MRAVNLIPADSRPGGGAGAAGRSGGAVYFLIGGLAIMLGLVAVWAMQGRATTRDRAELASVQQQLRAVQARAAAQGPSAGAAAQSAGERAQALRTLAQARLHWSGTLDAIARTLPARTWLTGLTAASTPSSAPGGAGGGAGVASSGTGPSVQISGCTPSQRTVAELMPRLRVVPGVQRVSLVSAAAAAPGATDQQGATGSCSKVQFQMVLFLEPPAGGAPATGAATTAPPGPVAAAPAAPGTTASVPAATTTTPTGTPQ